MTISSSCKHQKNGEQTTHIPIIWETVCYSWNEYWIWELSHKTDCQWQERTDLIKLTKELGSWWWNSFLPPPKHLLYIIHYSLAWVQTRRPETKQRLSHYFLSANNVSRFCMVCYAEKCQLQTSFCTICFPLKFLHLG